MFDSLSQAHLNLNVLKKKKIVIQMTFLSLPTQRSLEFVGGLNNVADSL